MSSTLTIEDLRDLCERYVPQMSRHPGSLTHMDRTPAKGDEWWYAHEIGHMFTVPPECVGEPYFGLGDDWPDRYANEGELRCYELAAMSVSRRLVVAAGRPDLARDEEDSTDETTLTWSD